METAWQQKEITEHYLRDVRGAIPYGADQIKLMLQLMAHFDVQTDVIMDLGCGNGFLAKTLFQAFSVKHAYLLDHSGPMLERAAEELASYAAQCELLKHDLEESLLTLAEKESVDCIVSGFAIHHLPHERKRELYREVYQLLAPGGMFINIEHTASASDALEAFFDERFIDHLTAKGNKSRDEVAREYRQRPDKADNLLLGADRQVDWLREIGFTHADCYFKWLELSVFGGIKPA